MDRLFLGIIALCLSALPVAVRAEVIATFYSHDMKDNYFPHAFIKLNGTLQETGEAIDTNYGFTAQRVSPAILLGSVDGMIETKDADYIAKSDAHFSVRLSDADYRKLMQHVQAWRVEQKKSYRLNTRNCVHFAMEAAALLGVKVNQKSKYFKKPKTFMKELMTLNPGLALQPNNTPEPLAPVANPAPPKPQSY
jgi:hypothetical protein